MKYHFHHLRVLRCRTLSAAAGSSLATAKMRQMIWTWCLLFLVGCTNNSSIDVKVEPPSIKTSYCKNELSLLLDSNHNWKVPVDSIQTIDEYHKRCGEQIHKAGTRTDSSGIAMVYPYILMDSVKVSLMYLLRPLSGGYFSSIKNAVTIYHRDAKSDDNFDCMKSVKNFYLNYKHEEIIRDREGIQWLGGPMVRLIFSEDDPFLDVGIVVREIITGYLEALQIHAEHTFQKELCEINVVQVMELQRRYPLQIRLLRQ